LKEIVMHEEPQQESCAEDEDFYMDGPYMVFTEAYHRKRGYCCQSGCRHCPYGFAKSDASAAATPGQG
jgi:hypothetical protein